MPREAKLFERFKGSPAKALPKLTVNIPPNWIERAREARKNREAGLARAMQELQQLRVGRPRALVAIKEAEARLRRLLDDWEASYRKECFYNGLRVLLELRREGESER
ncbi:MAG: hypothetical protein EHM13_04145 [Acidobacteria bacterium]|nr:MAG: hypothetical protein EHM13_04145 [Acidobacteriota bacterium]